MFAKLYERDGKQVLVKMDVDSETSNPEVRFFFEPDGFGVCSGALSYKDDSIDSRNKCEEFFNSVDEDKAFDFTDNIIKSFEL